MKIRIQTLVAPLFVLSQIVSACPITGAPIFLLQLIAAMAQCLSGVRAGLMFSIFDAKHLATAGAFASRPAAA